MTTPAPRFIALCAPAGGSGKSTVAEHLVERHGFTLVKFADPLKDMMRCLLFDHLGLDHATTEQYVDGGLKEEVIADLGVTSRHAQQTLGTEWGRGCIRDDIWVHITKMKIKRLLDAGRDVVCDDMRFDNEYRAAVDLGGRRWRIVRPGVKRNTDHASEGALDRIPMGTLRNDGTITDLRVAVDAALCDRDFLTVSAFR